MNKNREICREGESCREIDFRVQSQTYFTEERQDTTREEMFKKLIRQIETHRIREALKADLQQNQAHNPTSEQSKDMIQSMGNVEYFEMCEVSPKIQCPLCLTYCTKGIVCCRCGFCLPPTDQTREFNRDRFDVLSIPNYVIQKRLVRGRRCGNTDVQQLHHEAQDTLKEARK